MTRFRLVAAGMGLTMATSLLLVVPALAAREPKAKLHPTNSPDVTLSVGESADLVDTFKITGNKKVTQNVMVSATVEAKTGIKVVAGMCRLSFRDEDLLRDNEKEGKVQANCPVTVTRQAAGNTSYTITAIATVDNQEVDRASIERRILDRVKPTPPPTSSAQPTPTKPTVVPTTTKPTVVPTTTKPTVSPTTTMPTVVPTTTKPTVAPTTSVPVPTTTKPTIVPTTTAPPTSVPPTTLAPTTVVPTQPTTPSEPHVKIKFDADQTMEPPYPMQLGQTVERSWVLTLRGSNAINANAVAVVKQTSPGVSVELTGCTVSRVVGIGNVECFGKITKTAAGTHAYSIIVTATSENPHESAEVTVNRLVMDPITVWSQRMSMF